jgi:hypothetical protein
MIKLTTFLYLPGQMNTSSLDFHLSEEKTYACINVSIRAFLSAVLVLPYNSFSC